MDVNLALKKIVITRVRRLIYFINFIFCLLLCFHDKTQIFFTTFLSSFVFLRLLFCIRKRKIRVTLLTLFFILSIISVFIRLKLGSISTSMIMATLGVSLKASMGTLNTLSFSVFLFSGLLITISIFLILKGETAHYSRNEGVIYIITLLIVLSLPIFRGVKEWGGHFFTNNIKYSPTFISQDYLDNYKLFWGEFISATLVIAEDIINNHKYQNTPHSETPSFITDGGLSAEKHIIYIIGESSNPNRYSAYGYSAKTTPNIENWKETGKICLINKVHSPASQTRVAVPMLTSFSGPKNQDWLFKYKNLIEMAKAKGYQTYWFDSQNGISMWNKPFGYIAKYADIRATPDDNNTIYKVREAKDDDLIPLIKDYFSRQNEKSFYVIHLYGNHLSYRENIRPEDVDALPENDDYDRSIYYVDSILNKIINFADKNLQGYQLVYVSDHGEVVNQGHGYPTENNEMYAIPLFVTHSSYCDDIEKMRNINGYFSSNMLKYTILKMMGYNIDKDHLKTEVGDSDIILDEREEEIKFTGLKNQITVW